MATKALQRDATARQIQAERLQTASRPVPWSGSASLLCVSSPCADLCRRLLPFEILWFFGSFGTFAALWCVLRVLCTKKCSFNFGFDSKTLVYFHLVSISDLSGHLNNSDVSAASGYSVQLACPCSVHDWPLHHSSVEAAGGAVPPPQDGQPPSTAASQSRWASSQ